MATKKSRNFLTEREVELLLQQTSTGKNQERNACMLLLCYFHGLRVSEMLSLKLSDFDLGSRVLYVRRLKNGFSTAHPLCSRVFHSINKWLLLREAVTTSEYSEYLFPSPLSRGKMLTRQTVYLLFQRYGEQANLGIKVHPHMLRHACGFELANKGMDTRLIQDYLGHRNISHTVRYTASNPERFRNIRW